MYGVFTYIYHKHQPNVGKYTIQWTVWGMKYIQLVTIQETIKPLTDL